MKKTKYRGYHKKSAEVVYDITNGVCIFSGITPSDVVSTIQGAEKVIAAICLDAKIHPKDLLFYDLQTHLGYGLFKPGICEFSKLEVTVKEAPKEIFWRLLQQGEEEYVLSVESWTKMDCPDDIMQKFSKYSGCSKYDAEEQKKLRSLTPLIRDIFMAAYHGWDATVIKFLDQGVLIDGQEPDGNTAVHAAARGGHLSTLQLLKNRGADIHKTNNCNQTPYDVALTVINADKRQAVIKFFADNGADTNTNFCINYYK